MVKNAQDGKNQKDKAGQENQTVQKRHIRFAEDGVKTQYANIFNIGIGAEEVVFIFATPSADPDVVRVESKMAVSIKTAKRIAVTLGSLIRRYEAANGVIDIAAQQTDTEEKPNMQ